MTEYAGSNRGLDKCVARRSWDEEAGLYFCGHPSVHAHENIVSAGVCRLCAYPALPPPAALRPYPTLATQCRQGPCLYLGDLLRQEHCTTCRGNVRVKVFECAHPEHQMTTIRQCAACVDYEQRLTRGSVRRWAVGMTTARRSPSTVERTLESLAMAGWREVRVFAEAGADVPVREGVSLTRRDGVLGAWRNWFLSLAELYLRAPQADAYLMVQDDVVFCRGVRELLEKLLWPSQRVGVVSVYSAQGSGVHRPGFYREQPVGGFLGALTYIFPPAGVRSLLRDPAALAHHLRPGATGTWGIDVVVGEWSRRRGMPAFFHRPSLAQHIGDTSTVWGAAANGGRRRADDFPGETFDASRLLHPEMQRPALRNKNSQVDSSNDGAFEHAAQIATEIETYMP
jgi:hypothetical protein